MYKHMADSIKETAQKRFISQEDKDKYDGYEGKFIDKDRTYSKEEIEEIVSELETSYMSFEDESVNVENAKEGFIKDLELLGKTEHKKEIYITFTSLTGGSIDQDGTDNDENPSTTRK